MMWLEISGFWYLADFFFILIIVTLVSLFYKSEKKYGKTIPNADNSRFKEEIVRMVLSDGTLVMIYHCDDNYIFEKYLDSKPSVVTATAIFKIVDYQIEFVYNDDGILSIEIHDLIEYGIHVKGDFKEFITNKLNTY